VNPWSVYRFALSYPEERHWEILSGSFGDVPATLEDLRALYIELFEAGLPQPKCPLLENFYLPNRPPGEIVLENKLFYQHFGLKVQTKAAPDHLLTQLEFLSWLEHAIAAGNPDRASLERARRDFLDRHVAHWIPRAARSLADQNGRCYTGILEALKDEVAPNGSCESGE
jgi:DMSO reductase family type II enzyme chaperone